MMTRMKCPSPEDLALWFDQDRPSGKVGSHVTNCADCTAFVEALGDDRVLLQSAPRVEEEVYAAVRTSVLDRRAPDSRMRWRVGAGIAAGLAAAVLAAGIFRLPDTRTPLAPQQQQNQEQLAQSNIAAPAPVRNITPPIERVAEKRRPYKPRLVVTEKSNGAELIAALDALFEPSVPAGVGSPGQTVITMQTEDPNVAILVLMDSQGDEE